MAEDSSAFDLLLEHLKNTRGFDFTGYKRPTLERRVAKRMEAVGVEGHAEYLDYLEVHPAEFSFLFNTILINVTGFFRDGAAWDYLASETVPRLLDAVGDGEPIRVWCAGCASGEEAYTVAMLLAEAIGEDAYRERVKIYGTDIDEEALNQARHASYPAQAVESVPAALIERYFERFQLSFTFRKDLRRTVIFGRNDLVQDAPISRIDLLVCRNTLMYFNAETQSRILNRFHFALSDRGFLYLGRSEMLVTQRNLFRAVNLRRRVFTKVARPTLRERFLTTIHGDDGATADAGGVLRDEAWDAGSVATLLVDATGALAGANQEARALFGLRSGDLGRPLRDFDIASQPLELGSHIDVAQAERRSVALGGLTLPGDGGPRDIEVRVTPVYSGDETLGTVVAYHDVTAVGRLKRELQTSRHELETAYEELQATVEELETTNEELQSTNEELETINEELRGRSGELDVVNAFLESILTSIGVAVVVLDSQLVVQIWNTHAGDLWGLHSEETEGRNVLGLELGLPVERLKAPLLSVIRGEQSRVEIVLDAVNGTGRSISCRVVSVPLSLDGSGISGAVLLMEDLGEAVA
jgi:two-component system CheB/CheR fusion protein